jgi:hypothetical protein
VLLPEPYASNFKAAASGLGGMTIWSGSTDIWKEKSRLHNMPFYLAWKAYQL